MASVDCDEYSVVGCAECGIRYQVGRWLQIGAEPRPEKVRATGAAVKAGFLRND